MSFSTLTKLATRFYLGRQGQPQTHPTVEHLMTVLIFGLALTSLAAALRSGATIPLLFALQEVIIVTLMCCHRPNTVSQSNRRQETIELLLAWGGTALPLLLRPGLPAPTLMEDIGR